MLTIAVMGTLDTKGEEHAQVAEWIRARGNRTLLIDVGTGEPPRLAPDHTEAHEEWGSVVSRSSDWRRACL